MGEDIKKCYFCGNSESADCTLYITRIVDGRVVPIKVVVCRACKDEYEKSFPKY